MTHLARLMLQTPDRKFGYRKTQRLTQYLGGAVHVLHRQMLTAQTQVLLGSTRDFDLTRIYIGELNHIANQISPSTGTSGNQYRVRT